MLRVDCRSPDILVALFGMRVQHDLIDGDGHVRMALGKLLGAALMDTIVQLQVRPPLILECTDRKVAKLQPTQQHQAQEEQHQDLQQPGEGQQEEQQQLPPSNINITANSGRPSATEQPVSATTGTTMTTTTSNDDGYDEGTPGYKDQMRSHQEDIPIVTGVPVLPSTQHDTSLSLMSC